MATPATRWLPTSARSASARASSGSTTRSQSFGKEPPALGAGGSFACADQELDDLDVADLVDGDLLDQPGGRLELQPGPPVDPPGRAPGLALREQPDQQPVAEQRTALLVRGGGAGGAPG